MEAVLIYLLKAAGLTSIFYILYMLLLQNDTNFQVNRKFLLGGILTSIILPGIYFTKKVFVEAVDYSQFTNVATSSTPEITEPIIDWWQIIGILYLIVTGFLILKFLFQISQIVSLIMTKKRSLL